MLINFKFKENGKWSELNMTKATKTEGLENHVINCGGLKVLKAAVIFPAYDYLNLMFRLQNALRINEYGDINGDFILTFLHKKKLYEINHQQGVFKLYIENLSGKRELLFSVSEKKQDIKNIFKTKLTFWNKVIGGQDNIKSKLETIFKFCNNLHVKNYLNWFENQNIAVYSDSDQHCISDKDEFSEVLKQSNQVIKFTRNLLLMDLSVVRKDEIWFYNDKEKQPLMSLAEFKDVRSDLVISKSYLHGRFDYLPC